MNILSKFIVLIILLITTIIGMVTVSASAYGMGVNQDNTDPTLYRVSIAFFAIGLVITTFSLSAWNQGNYLTQQCNYVLKTAANTLPKATAVVSA